MDDIRRAYKILGLYPGSSQAEVKSAYRDLVQVWHPDRFAHDERLQRKAQNNLKRINDAYQALRDYQPPAQPGRRSRLSMTFEAVRGLGDMVQSGMHRLSRPFKPAGFEILGIDLQETPAGRRRPSWRWYWLAGGIAVVAAALVWLLS